MNYVHHPFSTMPPVSQIEMPTQDLRKPFSDPTVLGEPVSKRTLLYRLAILIPSVVITSTLVMIFADWFSSNGYMPAEIVIIALVVFSTFWITLSVASSTVGLLETAFGRPRESHPSSRSLSVALLIPIYNEDVKAVYSRIQAMKDQLEGSTSSHKFSFFILSDTQDEFIAEAEVEAFRRFESTKHPVPVFYRRRAENIDKKTGNIRDWVENWGGSWEAFVTLDADSLMSESALVKLADTLGNRNDAGLIQTVPRLIQAQSLFAKAQQFANNVYGGALAIGLERWSGREGNYWGHNAIIRTRAFAACAGLPKLSGNGALGGTIKSHDFVEAALLRRGGWSVYLQHDIEDTYEETPQTLVDYVLRDRRWCQGNLQHLRLLRTNGLKTASRFHMLQGAMSYVASVAWFALLMVWTLMGRSENESVFRYFSDNNPLFPQWPETDSISRMLVLFFMIAMLLVPKLFGLLSHLITQSRRTQSIDKNMLLGSTLIEIVISVAIAPIMMIQQVVGVFRTIAGKDTGWAPQNRQGKEPNWTELVKFHWLETILGSLLLSGIAWMIVTPWLIPVAISLFFSVPLSFALSKPIRHTSKFSRVMASPEMVAPPSIVKAAYEKHIQPPTIPSPEDGEIAVLPA